MNECSAYVGLDVHKDTIAVALPGREEPVYRGEIKNQRKSLLRLIRALSPNGELVSFCYEAGACGYGVHLYHAGKAKGQVTPPRWPASWWGSSGRWPVR